MPRQVKYIIPAHYVGQIKMPIWGSLPEKFEKFQIPAPPPGLDREERERVERLARRAVKKGYRRRAEDYPIQPWVARSTRRREYYLARLRYELALREGYKS